MPSDEARARADNDFLEQFPNLAEKLEEGYSIRNLGDVKASQRSILIGERVRFAEFLSVIGRAMGARRVECVGLDEDEVREQVRLAGLTAAHIFYRKTYRFKRKYVKRDVGQFVASLKLARLLLGQLINDYFPQSYRQQLLMTSDVDVENDPLRLIRLCCTPGKDVMSERRRFEARRQLTLAQLLLEFRLHGNGPEDLDADMSRFDDDMKRLVFVPQKSLSYKIVAELDPRNHYRVRQGGLDIKELGTDGLTMHSTDTCRVLRPDMRFIQAGERHIPVYYELRVKREAVWKLIRKAQSDTDRLDDLCGVKLVFLNGDDLMAGVDRLRRTIACEPGTISGDVSNLTAAGLIDPDNVHSSAEYRAKKYFSKKFLRKFEIQIMEMQDYVNQEISYGDENHRKYKLRSFLNDLFPRLFPISLYHLDWNDPHLRETLTELQLDHIWPMKRTIPLKDEEVA